MPPFHPHAPYRQSNASHVHGWSLLDALMALTILSLGIMVLIRLQTQLHIDGRNAMHRATATQLIAELHNRMLLNRDAALAQSYARTWAQGADAPSNACDTNPCNAEQLTQWDLFQWFGVVRNTLPNGEARIFHTTGNPRQIGVMVAWAHNDPLPLPQVGASAAGASATTCPDNTLCQLTYVEI